MTKKEIHIKSVMKKEGWEFQPGHIMLSFSKCYWKKVEPRKRKTYVHVIVYINAAENKAFATFFTEFTFKTPAELEKYYIVYNRVVGLMKELGIKLV